MSNNLKLIIVGILSILVLTGCRCSVSTSSTESKRVEPVKLVYDVTCYSGGKVIFEQTIDKRPVIIDGNNVYWTDDNTGARLELTGTCTSIPRKLTGTINERMQRT